MSTREIAVELLLFALSFIAPILLVALLVLVLARWLPALDGRPRRRRDDEP